MDEGSPLKTTDIEIKWGNHKAEETKGVFATNSSATTLGILIKGKFTISFENRDVVLNSEGDYVLFPAGVAHSWTANEDSLIITVRWPSIPNDQKSTQ